MLILQAPPPLEFSLPDGSIVIIPAATRQRLDAAAALGNTDVLEAAGATFADVQSKVLLALIGPAVKMVRLRDGEPFEDTAASAEVLAQLSPFEEMQILFAIQAQAHGHSPAAAAASSILLLNLQALRPPEPATS